MGLVKNVKYGWVSDLTMSSEVFLLEGEVVVELGNFRRMIHVVLPIVLCLFIEFYKVGNG